MMAHCDHWILQTPRTTIPLLTKSLPRKYPQGKMLTSGGRSPPRGSPHSVTALVLVLEATLKRHGVCLTCCGLVEHVWRAHGGSTFSSAQHFLQPSRGKISALEKGTKRERATTHSSQVSVLSWMLTLFGTNRLQDEIRDLVYSPVNNY